MFMFDDQGTRAQATIFVVGEVVVVFVLVVVVVVAVLVLPSKSSACRPLANGRPPASGHRTLDTGHWTRPPDTGHRTSTPANAAGHASVRRCIFREELRVGEGVFSTLVVLERLGT